MGDNEYRGTFLHQPFRVAEVLYLSGLPAGIVLPKETDPIVTLCLRNELFWGTT